MLLSKIKFIIILTFTLFLSSCITDVIESNDRTLIYADDIETLSKKIDLTQFKNLKDTLEIPIVAWWGVMPEFTSVERFKEVREAGFNLHYTGYQNIEDLKKALVAAENTGVKLLVSCPELSSDTKKTVQILEKYSSNGGYFIFDEPSASIIPRFKEIINNVKAIDNTRLCYINLLPNFTGNDPILSAAESYDIYLNRYIKELDLDIISFDNYPILNNNTLRYDWYKNLEIIKDKSYETKKDFWAFALTTSHMVYPVTSLQHLRLQIYSNLAYGAKGIQYFTYWTPPYVGWKEGPIDSLGVKNKTYDFVKTLNKEIRNMSYIFLSCKVLDIFHYGKIPFGTKKLNALPEFLNYLNIRGGNALISIMKNNYNDFIMIQNTNLFNDIGVKITFNTEANIILKNGLIVPYSQIPVNNEFKIEAGDMVIFMI